MAQCLPYGAGGWGAMLAPLPEGAGIDDRSVVQAESLLCAICAAGPWRVLPALFLTIGPWRSQTLGCGAR